MMKTCRSQSLVVRHDLSTGGSGMVWRMTRLSALPTRDQPMNGFASGSGEKYGSDSSSDESEESESTSWDPSAACLSLSAAARLNSAIIASKEPEV